MTWSSLPGRALLLCKPHWVPAPRSARLSASLCKSAHRSAAPTAQRLARLAVAVDPHLWLVPLESLAPLLHAAGGLSGGGTAAAEFKACVLWLDLGLAGDECIAGFAVDWSKCHGRVPVAVLREVVQRAGLPASLWRRL